MACHMGFNAAFIAEKTCLAQLVELIGADGGKLPHFAQIDQVGRTCRHGADACTGEGNLAGGAELIHHIRVPGIGAGGQDVWQDGRGVGVKVMHAVGVIPENAEIRRCGLQVGKALHHHGAEHNAGGVLVLGYAPDAFDGSIPLDQVFDHVHIGAIIVHGDGD